MLYRTKNIEVCPEKHQIKLNGQVVSLRPRTFRLLLVLLRNPGEIIDKHSLLNQVWGDTVVEEQALFQSIKEIRKLCGDNQIIKNYPRQGYAWAAAVEISEERVVDNSSKTRKQFRKSFLAMPVIASVVVSFFILKTWEPSYSQKGSVIVLPVNNQLFSLVTLKNIYDLGSGLNMYRLDRFAEFYYKSFPDDLVFNYVMLLASYYFKQSVKFFPLTWREEDQVSNVKLFQQAKRVLMFLSRYLFQRGRFVHAEMRTTTFDSYTGNVEYTSNSEQ